MSEMHAELPHEPAPPEQRRLIPEGSLLIRGLALAAVMVASLWLALDVVRRSVMLVPVGMAFAVAGSLAGWAAAIYLTGGEKHDDHPFV